LFIYDKIFSLFFPLGYFECKCVGLLANGGVIEFGRTPVMMNNDLRLLWLTGFCGGYTTFSTFASENIQLWQSGQILTVIAYTIASVLLGLVAVWLGLVMVKM